MAIRKLPKPALQVTHTRAEAWRAVVDRLMEVLYQHRYQLKALFRMLDLDGSGALDFGEFRAGLYGLNVLIDNPLTDDEILAVFRMLDRDNNNIVDYDEFVAFLQDLKVQVV